jgi:hypothetical protein
MLGYNLMQHKDYSNRYDKLVGDIDKMYMSRFDVGANLLQDQISLG